MMITREMVEAQRAQYVKRRQELWDNVNALSGAIDDCEVWLEVLGREEPSPLPLTPAPLPKGEGEEGAGSAIPATAEAPHPNPLPKGEGEEGGG